MMKILTQRGSIPTKRLVIGNVTSETKSQILAFAYGATGESAASTFGNRVVVHRDTGKAYVELWTD